MVIKKYFSTGEAAKFLGVKSHQISYAISNGDVEDSSFEFLNKRMFTERDLEKLKIYFDDKKSKKGEKNEI